MSRSLLLLRLAALVAAAAALLPAGCSSDDTVSGDGYGFDLPSGWHGQTDEDRDAGRLGLGLDTVVIGPETAGFATNVNVVPQLGLPPGLSIEEYVDLGFEQVRTSPQTFGLPADVEIEVIERAADGPALDGEPSREVVYSLDDGEMPLELRQAAALHNGVAYTITYSALAESFDKDIAGFDAMLSSWRWSDDPSADSE